MSTVICKECGKEEKTYRFNVKMFKAEIEFKAGREDWHAGFMFDENFKAVYADNCILLVPFKDCKEIKMPKAKNNEK